MFVAPVCAHTRECEHVALGGACVNVCGSVTVYVAVYLRLCGLLHN